ncbi:MAG: hypothetical protein R6V60_05080 [Desulfobacterales bacterium]
MHSVKGADIISTADDLALRAAGFVKVFAEKLALAAPLNVALAFHRGQASRLAEGAAKVTPPVFPSRTTTAA